jgi:long-chain acyl-CoA synthetase
MEKWDTIPKLVKNNYERWPDRPAMCMKEFGVWQRYTWKVYYETVKYLSLGMVSLGLQPGDVLSVIGDNGPQWFWAEFEIGRAHV